MVGGDYVARDVRASPTDGRLVIIAHLAGAVAELDIGRCCAAADHQRLDAAAAAGGQGARSPQTCASESGR